MALLSKHESASPMASVDQFCQLWFQRNQPQGEGSLPKSNLARGRQDWTSSIRWIKTNSKDSDLRSAELINDVKNIFNIITRWTIKTVRVKFFEFSKELIFVNQLSSPSQNFLTYVCQSLQLVNRASNIKDDLAKLKLSLLILIRWTP